MLLSNTKLLTFSKYKIFIHISQGHELEMNSQAYNLYENINALERLAKIRTLAMADGMFMKS
jgi:hypothetical protein